LLKPLIEDPDLRVVQICKEDVEKIAPAITVYNTEVIPRWPRRVGGKSVWEMEPDAMTLPPR
jgi:predicted GTPase